MFDVFTCTRCDRRFRNVRLIRRHRCTALQTRPSVYDRAMQRYAREQRERRWQGLGPVQPLERV